MPSPFPGMDPYLEHPSLWPGVHQRLITYASDTLNSILPPGCVANIGERLYVVQPDRDIYPGLSVKEHAWANRGRLNDQGAGVAVASDPPWILNLGGDEVREPFIEIRPVVGEERVITVIEVLSPSNKTPGEGRRLYRAKQREILASTTHLLEIDLLRQGEHTVAAPLELLRRKGPWDYLASLSRGEQRERCEAWAVTLRQRLPRVSVPLGEGEQDVVLDLSALFNRVYEEGAFARQVDYRRDPVIPLSRADADWADALLRECGFRARRE